MTELGPFIIKGYNGHKQVTKQLSEPQSKTSIVSLLLYCKQLSNLAQIFVFHRVALDKLHNFSVPKLSHLENRVINTRTQIN